MTSAFERANEVQRERKMIMLEEKDLMDRINQAYNDYVENTEGATVSLDEFLKTGTGMTKKRMERFGLDTFTEGRTGFAAADSLGKSRQGLENTRTALPSALGTMLKPLAKLGGVLSLVSAAIGFLKEVMFGIDTQVTDMAREFTISKEAAAVMREDIKLMGASIISNNACLLYTSPSPRDQSGSSIPY